MNSEAAQPQVIVEVPSLLADAAGGATSLSLEAATIAGAFIELRRRWPILATHVFNEAGEVRPHVLVLHNGKATRWMKSLDKPLTPGDRLTVVQAVSGG